MTGGWLTIRYCPSTSSQSLDSACRLSRVCALSATFPARFSARLASFSCSSSFFLPFVAALASFFVSATVLRIAPISSSSSRWAYQMSIVGICAKPAMASR